MRESEIQSKFIKCLEREGFYVIKIIQTNKNGIADLLCLHKEYESFFIEVKTDDGKVSELQNYRMHEIFEKAGIETIVLREEDLPLICK